METIGSLVDKLCIARVRAFKSKEYGKYDIFNEAIRQCMDFKNEIDELLGKIKSGEVTKIEEKKAKLYRGEDNNPEETESFGSVVELLFKANLELWLLEDKRRNKDLSDEERLRACDSVSTQNRIRNNAIDEINRIVAVQFSRKN